MSLYLNLLTRAIRAVAIAIIAVCTVILAFVVRDFLAPGPKLYPWWASLALAAIGLAAFVADWFFRGPLRRAIGLLLTKCKL
jgi:hypothetical protein